ncbi:MAG TPA: glycosyltransferase family 4 protein [Geodermatophilus sp.]|nr:glycosyltransferase family 4 protein [Geodermatophilus sp.]
MRVGVIAPPWLPVPPPAYGGIEAQVHDLARGLTDAGHDVVLAAPPGSTCPVPRIGGVAPAPGVPMGDGATELAHVVHAYGALGDVDLVHDHTLAGPLYRHRPAELPVVSTCHGSFDGTLGAAYRAMATDVFLVAISAAQASAAGDVPFAAMIHHGLDVDAVPVGPGSGGYVCFLGRMSPDKGVREAILIARSAGMPLKIAARIRPGSEQQYFEECIRPLLGGEVEFLGEAGAAAKYELLGDAVALLNPIRWCEPFGLVMIESLAAGTPVVATPRGSAPEIVEDGVTGFLRELAHLPDALLRVAELDRAACRAAAETRFSAERMVAEHLALYREVVAGREQGGRCSARLQAAGVPATRLPDDVLAPAAGLPLARSPGLAAPSSGPPAGP